MSEKYVYKKELLPRPVITGHDDWLRLYDRAWELAFKNVDYINQEGWKPQLTCMPGVGTIWQWDSCFMTLITNYSNGTITALNNLDNMYRLRRKEDGYISMAYEIKDGKESYGERINPPLYAWVEWEHYVTTGDKSRFEMILPIVEGLYSFIEKKRRRNCDLYWFEDPGSAGMDNSPRGGYMCASLNGSDICHIDLAGQQSLSALSISKICDALGLREKAEFYRRENKRINTLINQRHWCERNGFYHDFFTRDMVESDVNFLGCKTMAAAWTIICGAAKEDRLDKMIEHFFNPDEFYTKIPFASLSRDDINYHPEGGYWLGSVWAPVNTALIRGLVMIGRQDLARRAALKYIEGISEVNKKTGTIWECYAPEAYVPATDGSGKPAMADFVGWSGICPITMLIENIIGISFNAVENKVSFRISDYDRSGLENMNFCGGKLSVVHENGVVTVDTEKEINLDITVISTGEKKQVKVPAGHSEIRI